MHYSRFDKRENNGDWEEAGEVAETPESEAILMQANILKVLVASVMTRYHISPDDPVRRMKVEIAISDFWRENVTADYRQHCCDPKNDNRLKPGLYRILQRLSAREQAEKIMHILQYRDVYDFVERNKDRLRAALLAQGLDVAVTDEFAKIAI